MVLALVFAAVGGVMLLAELVAPRRDHGPAPLFRWRAVALGLLQIALAASGAALLDPLFQSLRPWSMARLGLLGGTGVGYLATTLVWYVWHRARHEVPFLWRTLHQVHHSPTRLELLTTYYKHPLEAASNVALGGFVMIVVLGLTPGQTAGVTLLCGLAEFFYHWNVKTPRWLGWIIQRPESHCVHHESGRHASNYADLPLWDWMFGTLDNPVEDAVPCGFGDDEERLAEMLAFREVV